MAKPSLAGRSFDTIVIGSGVGGLTAALALARAGQRVLVAEQHYLPGGWSHSFSLAGHQFSPGIHYIGDLGLTELVGPGDGSLDVAPCEGAPERIGARSRRRGVRSAVVPGSVLRDEEHDVSLVGVA